MENEHEKMEKMKNGEEKRKKGPGLHN